MGLSSEWDATAFNNGRRIVRDANGYFHAFWHARGDLPAAPTGTGAHIYYSYTTAPADEPPSMAAQAKWAPPICLTSDFFSEMSFEDHRYPSAAIEYDIFDGQWQDVNTIHLVWQGFIGSAEGSAVNRYEVLYASIPVANPPTPPTPFAFVDQLSWTHDTDSLVPSIAINRHWIDGETLQQNIHVVWQEEDINDGGDSNLSGDELFSDIAYIRSTNSGLTWAGPAGGWGGYDWDNITQTAANSQMPSVSCILDQFTGHPAARGRDELGYNTNTVHVAYHEDVDTGDLTMTEIHIFYQKSSDNGENWGAHFNVTLGADITGSDRREAYPSLAVDMLDRPHIAWMYNNLMPAEPLRQGAPGVDYLAGVNPIETRSFPGPNPRMYGDANNMIAAYYYDGSVWNGGSVGNPNHDNEYPTIALDRWMHSNVTFQSWDASRYDILRHTRLNTQSPAWPLEIPVYGVWSNEAFNDSNDAMNDDLFPSLAHKRVSLYASPDEPNMAGYDEVWTKVQGTEAESAINSNSTRQIWQDGNMTRGDPVIAEMEIWNEAKTLRITNNVPASVIAGTDYGLIAVGKAHTNRFIIQNTGSVNLNITGVSLGGDNPGDYHVVAGWPHSLNPTEEGDLRIAFQPNAYTPLLAIIHIENNTAEAPFNIHLAGFGAYNHLGLFAGDGTMTPHGETPVAPGATLDVELTADSDHYIGLCRTNGAHVTGVVGLLNHTVTWMNVSSDITTEATFMNTATDTATNNTLIPWLRRFYTNELDWAALANRALEDTDGDGMLGWQEYVADTDPTDSNSVFRVTAMTNHPPITIYFESSVERDYKLLGRTNLLIGTWLPVTGAGPRSGAGGADAFIDNNNPLEGPFYRLQVELP